MGGLEPNSQVCTQIDKQVEVGGEVGMEGKKRERERRRGRRAEKTGTIVIVINLVYSPNGYDFHAANDINDINTEA